MRLSLEQLGKQADYYDKCFLHVYAPVMTEYVSWVLKRAKADGINRLYFLARDGWLMYELAKKLMPKLGIDIDLRYIHVSRYVLRNAEYHFIGRKCIDSICVGGIDITFEKLMKRCALSDEEILEVAKELRFEDRLRECLSYAQIQELKVRIDAFGISFFEMVQEHSEYFYKSITDYFEYVGLTENIAYAIVDSGWLGTTAVSMGNILSHMLKRTVKVNGYYFGIYDIPKNADDKCFKSYYLHPNKDISRKVRFSICLFETLFSSPEGMTMGYENKNSVIKPICSGAGNPNEKLLRRNKELLMLYEGYLKAGDLSIGIVTKLLSLFMGSPTKMEAKLFGSLQFCDDVLELQMQNVAANWDMDELKKQSFLRKVAIKFFNSKEKLHESGWPEGSIVNLLGNSVKCRWALFNERLYKRGMYVRKAIKV